MSAFAAFIGVVITVTLVAAIVLLALWVAEWIQSRWADYEEAKKDCCAPGYRHDWGKWTSPSSAEARYGGPGQMKTCNLCAMVKCRSIF